MQSSSKIRSFALFTLIAQPIIFFFIVGAGILNSDENGFNGMQSILVNPIFLSVLVCYLLWNNYQGKFASNESAGATKLANTILVTFCVVAIIVDLGIIASAFLTDYHVNLFSFPPTLIKN